MYFDWVAKIKATLSEKPTSSYFGICRDISEKTEKDQAGVDKNQGSYNVTTIQTPKGSITVASKPWDTYGSQRATSSTGFGEADIPF